MGRDLQLFFPQWQGSGPGRELWDGAQRLRTWLPELPFHEVPVALDPLPCGADRVLGCGVLLQQQRAARRLIEAAEPDRIFTLGGDCGVELMPVSWLNRRYGGRLTVIWLDAHGDLNSPESSPSGHFHGMPLRFLLEGVAHPLARACFSHLEPGQVLLAGTRDLDAPERSFIQATGIRVLTAAEVEADPPALARQVPPGHAVYLHIDLDVLDPIHFPWVKCPAAGGFTSGTLLRIVQDFRNPGTLAGISVLEGLSTEAEEARELVRALLGACPSMLLVE